MAPQTKKAATRKVEPPPRKVVVWAVVIGEKSAKADLYWEELAADRAVRVYEDSGLIARIVRCEGVLRD